MLLDFEIANCSRQCAASGRALAPGEQYYSELHIESGTPIRRDFAADAWPGAATKAIAWWQARVPASDSAKLTLAPHDVLLNLFAELATEPAEAEFRYVLGLLLMRRRLVRLEDTRRSGEGEILVLYCPRREEQFELRAVAPDGERIAELERRVVDLLYGGE